jgi:hypothetical protein
MKKTCQNLVRSVVQREDLQIQKENSGKAVLKAIICILKNPFNWPQYFRLDFLILPLVFDKFYHLFRSK